MLVKFISTGELIALPVNRQDIDRVLIPLSATERYSTCGKPRLSLDPERS